MRETYSIAAPPVLAASGSHVGRVREINEDRIYADPDRGSFAVIDGVGGQAAGEHAAQTALDTIRQRLQLQIGTPAERVREAIALANDQIHQQALIHPDRHGMACVLTLVLLQPGALTAGHVGDTRLYKMRGGMLRKLTHDHSPIGEREDSGELSETEAMRHPRRNEIYREVGLSPRGPHDNDFIEVIEAPFEPDAALLLCSDGLTDLLSSAAIAEVIHRHAGDPARVVELLIDQANEAGGKDNVSVIYIEGAEFAPAAARRGGAPGSAWTQLDDDGDDEEARPSDRAHGAVNGVNVASGAPRLGASSGAALDPRPAAASAPSPSRAGATPGADARTPARASGGGTGKVWMFIFGLLVGVAVALGVAYAMRDVLMPQTPAAPVTPAPRLLLVGSEATAGYRTIGQAMADARAGDTIQVGPGEYREQVVVTDGINLVATPARQAILRAPAQALQPWTAVIVPGDQQGSRVSGLTIAGGPQAPIAIGVHVLGRTTIDDLEVSGTTIAAISLAGGSMSVSSTSVHDNAGPGFTLNGGDARLAHNVLARNGTAVAPGVDVVLSNAPRVTFTGNVIAGDPLQRVRGLAADQVAGFKDTNVVMSPPAAVAPRARPSPSGPQAPGPGAARPGAARRAAPAPSSR